MKTAQSPSSAHAAVLMKCPVEIICLVLNQLSRTDFLSLRGTCKVMNDICITNYGSKYFHTITTDLSRGDLERLVAMAEQSNINRRFQTLKFYVPMIHPGYMNSRAIGFSRLGEGYTWKRKSNNLLFRSNDATRCLENLLCDRFTECRTFIFCPHDWRAEFDLYRDKLKPIHSKDWLSPLDAITIVSQIASSEDLQIQDFHILSRPYYSAHNWYQNSRPPPYPENHGELPTEMLLDLNRVDFSILKSARFMAAWNHLRELTFRVEIVHTDNNYHGNAARVHQRNSKTVEQLLKSSFRLCKLNLALQGYEEVDNPEIMRLLLSNDRCTNLTDLCLSRMTATQESVSVLLRCCGATLRRFEIVRVNMVSGGWMEILHGLSIVVPQLYSIHLNLLSDDTGTGIDQGQTVAGTGTSICFPGVFGQDGPNESIASEFKSRIFKRRGIRHTYAIYYSGSDMSTAFTYLSQTHIHL